MSWNIPRVITLGPSGLGDQALVIAAVRAGALGVLDFELAWDSEEGLASARRVTGFLGTAVFGLRLPGARCHRDWLDRLPGGLEVLIVTEPSEGGWVAPLAAVRGSGRRVLAEATTRGSARAAALAGCDGLVLAGHEAGGRGGEDSSFILLQAVLSQPSPPVWVRGGVGLRVASACVAAGAAGVVLDGALVLARESPLDDETRARIGRWDGSETVVVGRETRTPWRVYAAPGSPVLPRLKEAADAGPDAWSEATRIAVGWGSGQAWPVGQDAAWAGALARRFVTVGGIVQAVEHAIEEGLRTAQAQQPLAEGAPLAESHGTRFPIVQGPMTRVSDTVAFAEAVAEGGALPFLALALMRGPEARTLLDDAAGRLRGRPWGVGILGFVPPELRLEQIEEVRRAGPPFALIAGGRPDQARELERAGIATYLHVPSPGLLRQYLDDGARRFVLEGRECGGHVGPRSSFTLWEQAVAVVLDAVGRGIEAGEVHLLFAGGIHDARSAAAVAALAAPLAERGARIGVLIGTAYLFTAEAVATGAIVPGFQSQALRCARTVLLETGPGHEVRVSPTPFADRFEHERRRLTAERRPADEVRASLEGLNAGRLRVAAKGVDRSNGTGSPMIHVLDADQTARGLYMLGQAATLRDRVTTIAALHREIAQGATDRLDRAARPDVRPGPEVRPRPSEIAIVGMAALMPGAADVRTFWENTLRGVDAITEIPADRWDWRLYYDPDPKAPDKIISKWGGFLPDVPFDPLRYGMPPSSLPSIEPLHLLTLETVRAALDDAGYGERPFPRERTAVVLGAGGGAAQLAMGYAFRSYLPLLDTVLPGGGREALERCGARLPEWTEDSFPGILLNVAAGRVANRFDLGGANYTVDAACGSSLAAAAQAVRELESGAADMVILGGADTVQNPFTYLAFSKTHAFSPRGRCRPFGDQADGIVISEAVAVLVLKRLADAERDGDRIYAVIQGVGASSDGRAKGLTAPRPEGQVRALRRAYEKAAVSPATVGYVEAHGTGTAAGDLAEVHALSEVFSAVGAEIGGCALGSVKSLIGHTKCAAGLAGLINAALALHHQVLPPTIGVEAANPRIDFASSPFRISTRTRPWLHPAPDHPRRAGVSAFGFGGTNFHAVLEAYDRGPARPPAPLREWPVELLVWKAPDRARLGRELEGLDQALERGVRFSLRDLSFTLFTSLKAQESTSQAKEWSCSLAIVAHSLDDLREKLGTARRGLDEGLPEFHDPRGVDFGDRIVTGAPRIAFLFPGQGAQFPEMLGELAVLFPEVRRAFETTDAALRARGRSAVGPLVFPPPAFSDAERARQTSALAAPEAAQPALGAACLGLLDLLRSCGVAPDVVAGHSFGELVALHAAGSFPADVLAELAEARGRFLNEAAGDEPGAMAALAVGPEGVAALLDGLEGVLPVNWNGPRQTVVSGRRGAVEQALERARKAGVRGQVLPVARAFHSPLVAGARGPLAELAARLGVRSPRLPVYSNVTAVPYAAEVAEQLGEHVVRPVRFTEMVEAMHAEGARVFLEVGPGATLTPLVASILGARPHLALACDPPGRRGLPGFLHALGRLFVAGATVRFDRLTDGRDAKRLDPVRFVSEAEAEPLSPSTWVVNGARARPAFGPEPARLGPGPALPTPEPPAERNSKPGGQPSAVSRQPSVAPPTPPERDRVFQAYQESMRKFLEVQRETMLAYLAGAPPAGSESDLKLEISHLRSPESQTARPPTTGRESLAAVAPARAADNLAPARHARSGEAAASGALLDGSGVAARLLALVRERTGYPEEMLRLDLDLEADLGIDSIKRVEILGSLRDALPALGARFDTDLMDRLGRARTLGAIVEQVGKALAPAPSPNGHSHVEPPPVPRPARDLSSRMGMSPEPVRRSVLEVVEAPLAHPVQTSGLVPGGLVLVTEDGTGVARDLAFDLRSKGHPVVRVAHGSARGCANDCESVDLTSAAEVASLLDRVRTRGVLTGIVHALPLRARPAVGLDPSGWAARLGPEVRGLYLLAHGAADDLDRAAAMGGACLIAATALGGAFASAGTAPADFFPGHGAVAGLVKTLAREWPDVRARVVDFDLATPIEVMAANLVQEALADDERPEVGYLDRRRVALRAVATALPGAGGPGVELKPGEPLLVTGGARGITAAVAADLARRWRPTLLLTGTSPLPPDREDPATAGLAGVAELKAALWKRLSRTAGPAEVERAYQALRREREIRENLRALRETGAAVEYAQADVRDPAAMKETLDSWRRRFGPVAGLIHGAGVIQDKLLRDKTPESFECVLSTKLDGALNLARLLEPEALRFAAFFSSVAGRFGNVGQSDYAAANDALNKLALWLDRSWPGRVVSLMWGPWSGVGMVSDLEGHLGRLGLGLIAPEQGDSLLADELRLGRKGAVEVVLAGELGALEGREFGHGEHGERNAKLKV